MAVWFVGPLPPPVHGFSNINAEMLARLQQRGPVVVLDRAPPRTSKGTLRKLLGGVKWLGQVLHMAVRAPAHCRKGALYLGLSGGKGQWLDLPFLWLARVLRLRTFVHHHSFAYLNSPSALTARLLAAAARAHHITLCDDMKAELCRTYGLQPAQVTSLSNAAFMPMSVCSEADCAQRGQPVRTKRVVVGFLSNITADKGIFSFFDLLAATQAQGLPVDGVIAGPVDASVREAFDTALSQQPAARHVGPVYGEDKLRFLNSIDVLLFPTQYANEAEPLTIHEAVAQGVSVVAATRGCIGSMLPTGCGAAVPMRDWQVEALRQLTKWLAMADDAQQAQRHQIQQQHGRLVQNQQARLEELLASIGGT